MKIIDCCIYNGEVDLLRLRLAELQNCVTDVVIIEADHTHKGNPKELEFDIENPLITPWKNRIHYHVCKFPKNLLTDIEREESNWEREQYHREYIGVAVETLHVHPSDIILISDCDEIPNPKKVSQLKGFLRFRKHAIFVQRMVNYYFNYQTVPPIDWCGTVAVKAKQLRKEGAQQARRGNHRAGRSLQRYGKKEWRRNRHLLIYDGGWHFSWFGGQDMIQKKLSSFTHNYSADDVKKKFENYDVSYIEPTQIDRLQELLPSFLLRDRELLERHLK
jgi:beta-1,4-mannosyl-glycoprotein beta-1,4-N-acetylglucosaminyltransferase